MSRALFSTIESARLIIRHFKPADLPLFHAYRNDPEVARYQGWDTLSEERALSFINEMAALQPGIPGEWFQFAVELKESGLLIGDCAMKLDTEEPRQAEIGYSFARRHQGNGYASEAVSTLLDYAFGSFGLHRVTAFVICGNERSIALLERIGMRREGHFLQDFWHKGSWVDEYLYALLESEWLSRSS